MTLFDHVMLQARSGLSDIDQDRDRALSFIARYGGSPGLDAWLEQLAADRAQQLLLLDGLQTLQEQSSPALLMHVRPTRMLKVALRGADVLSATGTDPR
jgi:hypothetical protein